MNKHPVEFVKRIDKGGILCYYNGWSVIYIDTDKYIIHQLDLQTAPSIILPGVINNNYRIYIE